MAIVRVLNDGPRDHVIHITGTLAAATETTTINPAAMSVGGFPDGKQIPNDLAISQLWYGADTITTTLIWDATVDELAWVLGASGSLSYFDFRSFGDIPNRSGAGKTGQLLVTALTGTGNYSVILALKKKYL